MAQALLASAEVTAALKKAEGGAAVVAASGLHSLASQQALLLPSRVRFGGPWFCV